MGQAFLKARGYETGPACCCFGRRSTRAMQAWIKDQGEEPGPIDGCWGRRDRASPGGHRERDAGALRSPGSQRGRRLRCCLTVQRALPRRVECEIQSLCLLTVVDKCEVCKPCAQ